MFERSHALAARALSTGKLGRIGRGRKVRVRVRVPEQQVTAEAGRAGLTGLAALSNDANAPPLPSFSSALLVSRGAAMPRPAPATAPASPATPAMEPSKLSAACGEMEAQTRGV